MLSDFCGTEYFLATNTVYALTSLSTTMFGWLMIYNLFILTLLTQRDTEV